MIQTKTHYLSSGDTILVVTMLEQRFTASNVPDFKQAVRDAVAESYSNVIVDISAVTFMDSSGLGALVGVARSLGDPSSLRIVCPPGAVMDLFRLTRMEQLFTIYDTLDPALAA